MPDSMRGPRASLPPGLVPPCHVLIGSSASMVPGLTRSCSQAGLLVRGCVVRRADLLQWMVRSAPDLLLLDVEIEGPHGGLEFLEARGVPDEVATVLVAREVDGTVLERTRRLGVAGFVVWPASQDQFDATLYAALGHRGRSTTSSQQQLEQATTALQQIAAALAPVRHIVPTAATGPTLRPLPELATLSPREWDVLRGLISHKRVPSLAKEMHISPHTVRNHLKSIFAKLSVHSQSELLDKVIDHRASVSPISAELPG